MKKVLYSPDVIEKLQEIKQNIRVKYGVQTSNKIIERKVLPSPGSPESRRLPLRGENS